MKGKRSRAESVQMIGSNVLSAVASGVRDALVSRAALPLRSRASFAKVGRVDDVVERGATYALAGRTRFAEGHRVRLAVASGATLALASRTFFAMVGVAMVALALSSCESELEGSSRNAWDRSYIMIGSAQLGLDASASTRTTPLGSSSEQAVFANGDVIELFCLDESESGAEYTYDGSSWSSSSPLKWAVSGSQTLTAQYPVQGSYDGTFTLPTDQSSLSKVAAADFMTAEVTYSAKPDDGYADLSFSRQTSKISVSYQTESVGDGLSATVTDLKIYSPRAVVGGSLSPTAVTPYSTDDGSVGSTWYALVAPYGSTYSGVTFVEVTVEYTSDLGSSYTRTQTVSGIPAHTAGYEYDYALTIKQDEMEISSIGVTTWIESKETGMILDSGYEVIVSGNSNGIAFNVTMETNSLTVECIPTGLYETVNEVTYTGTATVTQEEDTDSGARTITVSELESDVVLIFNGVSYSLFYDGTMTGFTIEKTVDDDGVITLVCTPEYDGTEVVTVTLSGTATWSQSQDSETGVLTIIITEQSTACTITFAGVVNLEPAYVYAVASDGETLVDVDDADSSCIGVVLDAQGYQFMIAKYEGAYESYGGTTTFTWGGYGTDTSITNRGYPTMTDGVTAASTSYGFYVPSSDGTYGVSGDNYYYYSISVEGWTSGPLLDFDGASNSEILKTVTDNGSYESDMVTIGSLLNTFLETEADNEGFDDWYIPAAGQMALIYMYKSSINSALSAIGGYSLSSSNYWSSTENGSSNAWSVGLSTGGVGANAKYILYRVRFVRGF